jgi:hypothetical protein
MEVADKCDIHDDCDSAIKFEKDLIVESSFSENRTTNFRICVSYMSDILNSLENPPEDLRESIMRDDDFDIIPDSYDNRDGPEHDGGVSTTCIECRGSFENEDMFFIRLSNNNISFSLHNDCVIDFIEDVRDFIDDNKDYFVSKGL